MDIDMSLVRWNLSGQKPDGENIRIPIKIPGDNASALLDAGLLPDPYSGANEELWRWIGETSWKIAGTFAVPELDRNKKYTLEIDSLDTCADIYINGEKAGTSDNMFLKFRKNITRFLRSGENSIEIVFSPVPSVAQAREDRYFVKHPWNRINAYPHMQHVRKVQCHSGWDWGITLMVCGIYGEARIVESEDASLLDVLIRQKVAENTAYLQAELEFESASSVSLPVEITFDDKTLSRELAVPPGKSTFRFDFEVENPELWYPAEYGPQKLYDLTISATGRTLRKKIGFRSVELVREKDGEDTVSFYFKINGIPIPAKGADWIPCDAIPGKITRRRFEDLLFSARFANMNMIRVWGGGMYEPDAFYDLCDELGIMVWQDCMFACLRYPANDEFLDSVEKEIAYQVKRLSSHASIVSWCGDNEGYLYQGQFSGRPESIAWALDYDRLNQTILRTIRKLDENIVFWNSSPYNGNDMLHLDPNGSLCGDTHNWEVWHGGKSFDEYQKSRPGFCSEFGFQSFPSLYTVRKYISGDDWNISSPVMEAHQKNPGGNANIYATFARYFRLPKDFENTLYLSWIQQALAIKTGVEFWRSTKPRCMGTLYWQFNDNWPVASWSGIDYTGNWKALHYAARRFYAPVLVTAAGEGNEILFSAVNDTKESVSGKFVVNFHNIRSGKVEKIFDKPLIIPPDRAVRIGETAYPEQPETGFYQMIFAGDVRVENEFFPTEYKRYTFAKAAISTEVSEGTDGFTVTLTARDYTFFVFLHMDRVFCRFDDNMFTLYPGKAVEIRAWTDEISDKKSFLRNLKINTLNDSY